MRWIVALCLLLTGPAYGASFYISTTGSDSNACTNQTTDACASFPRCITVMAPGDTCYALDGTYNVWDTNPGSHPNQGWVIDKVSTGSSSARYRLTSLSQDASKVVIKRAGTDSATKDTWKMIGGTSAGDTRGENIEIDHLTLEGRFQPYGNFEDILYHNNICRCPNTGTGGGNQGCFYTARSPLDMHTGIQIYENRFVYEASCPAKGTNPNIDFIVLYDVSESTIEKNDFVDTDAARPMWSFIFFKSQCKDMIVRNNYIYSADKSGEMIEAMDCSGEFQLDQYPDRSSQGGSAKCNNEYYNNIVVGGSNSFTIADSGPQLEKIYNNTFVSPGTRCIDGFGSIRKVCDGEVPPSTHIGCSTDADCTAVGKTCVWGKSPTAIGYTIYNNICYSATNTGMVAWPPYGATADTAMRHQTLFDYNLYYPHSVGGSWGGFYDECTDPLGCTAPRSANQKYGTLADWKAHLSAYGLEQNSVGADPLFVSLATNNYKLQAGSPAIGAGRSGSTIGAYITGTEQIGCSFDPRCYSYNAAEAPSTSGNPRRVDMRGVSFK